MINRQFLYFKTEASFLDSLEARKEIKDDSIVFIEDKHAIWTHGQMFGTEGGHAKGFFKSVEDLPAGVEGDWAIVNVDGKWYIYTYSNGWQQGEEYEFSNNVPIDMDEIYVRKDNIRDFIRNIYDDIFVKKVEVYTPDQYDSDEGSDSPGSSSGSGSGTTSSITVDQEINKNSFNPVANWVIYNALKAKADKADLGYEAFEEALLNSIREDLEGYYTKEEVDELIQEIPSFTFSIVDELPSNPDRNVLYLVKDPQNSSQFTQYVYKNDEWVSLGTQTLALNLSGYATKTEVNNLVSKKQDLLQNKVNIKALNVNGAEVSLLGAGVITIPTVSQQGGATIINAGGEIIDMSDYATKDQLNNVSQVASDASDKAAENKVAIDTINGKLGDFYKKSETYSTEQAQQYVQGYTYDKAAIDRKLFDLGTQDTPTSLDGYATQQYVDEALDAIEDFHTNDLPDVINSYISANDTLKNYVSHDALSVQLDDYVAKADVYTPAETEESSVTQTDTAGYDPHTRRAGANLTVPTYVTHSELEELLEMVSSGTGTRNVPKHVILEESEYNKLTEYAANTLYFVLEPKQEWTFGGTFPITLSAEGIGTFPINLV